MSEAHQIFGGATDHFLDGHGKQDVVAPPRVDVHVALEQAFTPEPDLGEHGLRRIIRRLDGGLEAMESDCAKGVVDAESHCGSCDSVAVVVGVNPVTDPRVADRTALDAADGQLPNVFAVDLNDEWQ